MRVRKREKEREREREGEGERRKSYREKEERATEREILSDWIETKYLTNKVCMETLSW